MRHQSFHKSVKCALLASLIAVITGWSSGNAAQPGTVPAPADDSQQRDVIPERGCVVRARIVDDRTGKPLAGIRMSCFVSGKDEQSSRYQEVQTDENGYFQVVAPKGSSLQARWEDARDGSYLLDRVWLRQRGGDSSNYEYQPLHLDSVAADKSDIVLKLRLLDMRPFSAKVVDGQAQPMANASVYFSPRINAVTTDAAGDFTIKIPSGRSFALCAISADQSLGAIAKFSADSETGRIILVPTINREGCVTTPAGLPADNLKFYLDLKLNDESCYQLRQEPITDAKGMFHVEHLVVDGKYSIFWTADNETNRDYDYGNAEIDLAGIKDGDLIKFTARKYVNAMIGQVVDRSDKPIAGAKVTVDASSDLITQDERSQRSQTGYVTDKDGNFIIPRLADGELTLIVTAPGCRPTKFKTATDNVDCRITMRPTIEPAVCRATVKDAHGKPVAGAEVTLFTQQYTSRKIESSNLTRRTGDNGVVTFDTPATAPSNRPEQFTQNVLLCDVPGFDLDISATSQAGEDIDAQFTLTQSAQHWKGTIVDEKNQPIASARIVVTGFQNRHHQHGNLPADSDGPASTRFTSAANGTFELTRIPHNWVNIMITAPGMRTSEAYFDPQADTATDMKSFTVKQSISVQGNNPPADMPKSPK